MTFGETEAYAAQLGGWKYEERAGMCVAIVPALLDPPKEVITLACKVEGMVEIQSKLKVLDDARADVIKQLSAYFRREVEPLNAEAVPVEPVHDGRA